MTKGFILATASMLVCLSVGGQEPKKEEPRKPVGALAAHPLDAAFAKAATERDMAEAVASDELFKKAIAAAAKAKADVEERRKDPKFVGPSPAQAARTAFLRVLNAGKDR